MKTLALAVALTALASFGLFAQPDGSTQDPWSTATFNNCQRRSKI
jgi:hypothetical protein